MFKNFFTLSLLISISLSLSAQSTDSVTVVKTPFQTLKFANTLKLHRYQYKNNLFNSTQNVSIIEVKKPTKQFVFKLFASPKELIKTSEMAKNVDAYVAINGNFFDMKNGGAVDYTKVDGVVVNENKINANNSLNFNQKAAIVIKDGKLIIIKGSESVGWEQQMEFSNMMLTGPLLLLNSQKQTLDSNAFNSNRHPRTCVGIKKDGTVLLAVVDGRSANAEGMSLFELEAYMRWLGCKDIINLDGGGSSALYVKGLNNTGIVNFPSDNKLWDHDGERKVANILYLKKK